MQMHAMNQFGNRGFGGPPQPQRQGGRRGNGNNRGGFRNTRFEPNNQQQQQRNPNQGQRPISNEVKSTPPAAAKPVQQQPQQNQPQNKPPQIQQQNKPQNEQLQQNKPQQQQQNKPQQQQQNKPQQQLTPNKPQQQQLQNKPQQQQQNKPQQLTPNKPQQQQLQNKPQQQQNKLPLQQQQNVIETPVQPKQSLAPVQNAPVKLNVSQDNVDLAINETKGPNQSANLSHQQPKNMNGNFGGNKPGGWNQGGQGGQGQGGQGQGGLGGQGHGGQGQGGQGGFGGQGGHGNKGGFNQGNRQFGNRGSGGPGGQGGPPRNQQRGRGGQQMDGKPPMREEHMLANKLRDLVGPLIDLAPIEQTEVKFNGRSRLYIGNLTSDATEEEINKMFSAFGESAELFINKDKNFGFIKMDYRVNAERAKRELDGKLRNGRNLRVRFAPHNCAIRVKNLPPWVSNELLYRGFEIFGRIERAYVRVDERGKPLGEGIVEYSRKPSALAAIRNCTEKCFFLTSSLRPVIVESFEEPDEFDGYPEKNLPKKHPEFLKAREMGPRFSELNSFEHEYGTRWKQLHELHRQKEEALKKELASEEEKLEAQMEYAKYEHETEMLREQLRQREQDRDRQKRSWEMAERAAETRRESDRAALQLQEEELSLRMRNQDDELRRRQQENTLFVQAQRLNSMLDRQEQGMFDQQSPMDGGFREQYDMPRGSFDDVSQGRGWEGSRQMDEYPNKRRRY